VFHRRKNAVFICDLIVAEVADRGSLGAMQAAVFLPLDFVAWRLSDFCQTLHSDHWRQANNEPTA
jgi:hypothetical protein